MLDALKNSSMFREDQYSYMLYPDRQLPRFVEKNNIPAKDIASSALLQKLLTDKDLSVVSQDSGGGVHFNGAFRKAGDLEQAMTKLSREDYSFLVQNEKELVMGIFERIFDHQSFTGRSGTFYGYEGLGTPGTHAYLHCNSEANGIIDAVRAAQQLGLKLSNKWMVVGQSQGGQAALCTGAFASGRAPGA